MNEQQSDTSSEGPFPYASTVRVIGVDDEGTDHLPPGTEGVVTHSYSSYTSFNVGGAPHCYWNRNLELVPEEEQTEELMEGEPVPEGLNAPQPEPEQYSGSETGHWGSSGAAGITMQAHQSDVGLSNLLSLAQFVDDLNASLRHSEVELIIRPKRNS